MIYRNKIKVRVFCVPFYLLLYSTGYAQLDNQLNTISISKESLSIKRTRTISFRTDEISFMDSDISPDNSTILFSLLGDLFTVPVAGGRATQITRGLAMKHKPIWSPDGKKIAYFSDATGFMRLHVNDIEGSFDKVIGETYVPVPVIWLDSESLIYMGKVYSLAGTESTLPGTLSDTHVYGVSADKKFLFCREEYKKDSGVVSRYNIQEGVKTEYAAYPQKEGFRNEQITPDGRWLVYMQSNTAKGSLDSLMAIDLQTGVERLLAKLNIAFLGPVVVERYSFSPDGRFVYIAYAGKIHRIELATSADEIIPFTADVNIDMGALTLNNFPLSLDSLEVKYTRSAVRSPDGKQLVFSALNHIYVMDLPNGRPRLLVEQPFSQFHPAYSPHGKWIAYVSWDDVQGGQVWYVSAKGGKPKQITHIAGLYMHPSWSNDGKQIVVVKGENKTWMRDHPGIGELQVISVLDKKINVLADSLPLFNQPEFSVSDREIMYKPNQRSTANTGTIPKLVAQSIVSGNTKVIAIGLNVNEDTQPIRQITQSPDGRFIVFGYNQDLYLSPLADLSPLIFNNQESIRLIRFARGGIDPHWEQHGKILSWSFGNMYYRVDPDKIIEAAHYLEPNPVLPGLPKTYVIDADITPDETVQIHLMAPRLYGKGIIALKNARIITMEGDKVIEKGTIIIRDGRLAAVGPSSQIRVPAGVRVMDMTDQTIMPGLIDIHSHMKQALPPDVLLKQSSQRLQNLSFGVTTVRDPSGSHDSFGYGEIIETGQMTGPRLFTVGQAVRPEFSISNINEANVVAANRTRMGATAIKQYLLQTRLQRQLLLLASEQAGVNMTNEVEPDPVNCMGQIKDGSSGVEHMALWGETYKDIASFIACSGTTITPTLQVCNGAREGKYYFRKIFGAIYANKINRFEYVVKGIGIRKENDGSILDSGFLNQAKVAAAIVNAGGKVAMGSHGEDQGIGAHWELWALQMGGITNLEALQCATIRGAEALGIEKDLGSIEVGKIADLIVLNNNPLEDIHNSTSVKYVMKTGVLYDGNTLDTLWPFKQKCPIWRF